jgi:DNA-binding XRE family transcriptional regulator
MSPTNTKRDKARRPARVQIAGRCYVIVEEQEYERLRAQALGAEHSPRRALSPLEVLRFEEDREALARRLIQRRQALGLSQAELARAAGVRVETLNRIERARTAPDFTTLRKLATAMEKRGAQR